MSPHKPLCPWWAQPRAFSPGPDVPKACSRRAEGGDGGGGVSVGEPWAGAAVCPRSPSLHGWRMCVLPRLSCQAPKIWGRGLNPVSGARADLAHLPGSQSGNHSLRRRADASEEESQVSRTGRDAVLPQGGVSQLRPRHLWDSIVLPWRGRGGAVLRWRSPVCPQVPAGSPLPSAPAGMVIQR